MFRKILAVTVMLVGAGWVALTIYANHVNQQRMAPRLPSVVLQDTRSLKDNVLAYFLPTDGLNAPVPTSLGDSTIRYVSQKSSGGDGSQATPWSDLQAAMCALEPGDTLMVLEGDYGPVAVDEDCAAGTQERPIKIYFSRLSKFRTPAEERAMLLELRQPHWAIYGLEAHLAGQQTGVRIGPGVKGIHLEALKIHGGNAQGVRIGFGASDIRVHRSHIHHIGINAQGTAAELDGVGMSAAVMLEPGARNVSITESKFHHIGHAPIYAIRASEMPGMIGLSDPEFFVDEATRSPSEEDAWWSQPNPTQ